MIKKGADYMDCLEIEVKFFLQDLQPVKKNLTRLGGENSGRFFETNIRFEDRQSSLIKKNALLRLRKDDRVSLTYKSSPDDIDENFKVYNELEVEVSDFKTMESILNSLGFYTVQVYEKWRETLVLENTHFCLDTMPFGNFLEIEGSRDNIKKMARQLGLDWNERILFNYLKMFETIKAREKFLFSDVTFENFRQISFDFYRYLPVFTQKGNS
jgi:adenylate cyclase class 2